MNRCTLVVVTTCLALACTVNNPYDGETFVSATGQTNGSGSESSSESGSESTGDGDGDPATGDGDGDMTTTGDGDGDGDMSTTGDGDGDMTTTGDGDGDPPSPCTRYRFSYQLNTETWEEFPLDQVWTGPNAPPCAVEPSAATSIQAWDQLLVWGSDGLFYRRIAGAWEPPEPIAQRWGVVANVGFDGVNIIPPFPGKTTASVLFGTAGTVYSYELFENGNAVFDMSIPVSDEALPAPPAGSNDVRWAAAVANPNMHPAPEWLTSYSDYGDGRIYYLEGFTDWSSWPVGSDPIFADPPAGVSPAGIEAAWGEVTPKRVFLIGTKQ